MYLKIVDRVIYCAIIHNRSTYSPSESFSWEREGSMRKFSVMMLMCLVMTLVGCKRHNFETEELALKALATEGGWTVTHWLWYGTRVHIVRVKSTEDPKKGLLIQDCVAFAPITAQNLRCLEEDVVFFPQ